MSPVEREAWYARQERERIASEDMKALLRELTAATSRRPQQPTPPLPKPGQPPQNASQALRERALRAKTKTELATASRKRTATLRGVPYDPSRLPIPNASNSPQTAAERQESTLSTKPTPSRAAGVGRPVPLELVLACFICVACIAITIALAIIVHRFRTSCGC